MLGRESNTPQEGQARMKIYSNRLTEHDVYSAFHQARTTNGADIWPEDVRAFRPRSEFRNGIQFYAYSHGGNRATGHRSIGSYSLEYEARAASWDAYGWVIARLYLIDPNARIGQYRDVADFVRLVSEATYRREPKDFLGLVRHVDYPHEPGRLYDCPACESSCHCVPGYTQCVYSGKHNGSADKGTERFPTAE
jgi:hypothetical protein